MLLACIPTHPSPYLYTGCDGVCTSQLWEEKIMACHCPRLALENSENRPHEQETAEKGHGALGRVSMVGSHCP